MSEIIIAYATTDKHVDECKLLLDDHRAVFGFVPRIAVESSRNTRELLLAWRHGEVVGFVRFHRLKRIPQTTIYEILVHPDYRKRGIGRRLIEKMIQKNPVRLKCPVDSEFNLFYEHLGFQLIDREPGKRRELNVWEYRPDSVQ